MEEGSLIKSDARAYVNVGRRIVGVERILMKSDVRAHMKGRWFKSYFASLIIGSAATVVFLPLLSFLTATMAIALGTYTVDDFIYDFFHQYYDAALTIYLFGIFILILLVGASILPLFVSREAYFLRSVRGDNPHLEDVVSLKGRYFAYLGMVFLRGVFICLWSLLAIVPGIVKMIAYSFASYILSENPKMGARRALKLSVILTNGHKGELFALWLSFVGWGLLGVMTFGLLFFYVQPYYKATYAAYYDKLKEIAVSGGKVNASEFEMASPAEVISTEEEPAQ